MKWNELLQPDLILEGSVLTLTSEIIQQYELRGLILDVDETLVPINVASASSELCAWIAEIRAYVSICLVSNNINENRIGSIARCLNLPYYLGAAKPSRRKMKSALKQLNLPAHQVGMVGDRLFTDVVVGNRLGMFSILVEPIVHQGAVLRSHPIRNFEVLISEILGASIKPKLERVTNPEEQSGT